MMRKSIFTLGILFILISPALNAQVNNYNVMNIVDFHSISVNSAYTVYVKQSNKEEVRVEAEKEIYDLTEITVQEGVLHINIKRDDSKSSKSIWQKIDNIKLMPTLKVYVSIKDVQSLSVNGNGKLITENSIASDKLSLLVAGTGSMEVDIKSKSIDAKLTGPGSLTIKGYADNMDIENSGAGSIEAYDFEVQNSNARLYGLGSMKINVSNKLDAKIYGSGNLLVKGATKEIVKKEYGSGLVERKN
ncbi:head GIN domain-containing protein [Marivirga harenae]|uniref:head GIN domain-containing protein n=1 Tax=Marivirga harenae TaxID=2010992 RepID=UPI0026DFE963|nr:head GIN domain-containing protein [Marivirga harenae]WKV12753.1 head GIN domain-containing protein [Marivirga harenae]|tara:strand:- start:4187 stop:4924 length:738 start_codon:yes stop_codon:yes gene_type:complete